MMGLLGGLFGGRKDRADSPEALRDIKWGMAQPVMFRLSSGIGKFMAFGKYTLKISDPDAFREKGCDLESSEETQRLKATVNIKLIQAFADSVGPMAASLTAGELVSKAGEIQSVIAGSLQEGLQEMGLSVGSLVIEKIVQSQ